MSYTITRFGSITLPVGLTNYTLSPVPAQLSIVQTTAGAYNNNGSGRQKQAFPHSVSYKCTVTEDTLAANRAVLDTLRAAVGTQGRLYRTADDDGTIHYCTAILIAEPHERPYGNRMYIHELELSFQQMGPWRGAAHGVGWTLDSGVLLDNARNLDETPPTTMTSSPEILTITNAGNLPVDDARVIVTAGSSDIDHVYLTSELVELRWVGTLEAGTALEIDAGAFSVTNAGSDAYAGFTIQPDHSIEGLLQIPEGNSLLAVYFGGGGTDSTVAVIFNDGWA